MSAVLANSLSRFVGLSWLAGPIFDKELRVCSRRRRSYVLRCAYIAALCVFVLSVWYSVLGTRRSGTVVYQVSRLSQIGRTVIASIVWFQFVVAQLVAVVMLSSSVSDEVRTGTLAVLMTTPIRHFQIVAGKLLSKLLQVTLLLAISLPLLAVVRVFGGVTWAYVISSVCISLTAALLAGTLSLLLSMIYRQTHTVILVTIMWYMVLFGAVPALFTLLAAYRKFIFDQNTTQSILVLTNPFWAFAAVNAKFLFQSGVPRGFSWPLHCLIMLALTAVVLAVSVRRMRKVAVSEAFGRASKRWFARFSRRKTDADIRRKRGGEIKPVIGSPIVWKEMRKGVIGHRKGDILLFALLIGAFLISAVVILLARAVRNPGQVSVTSMVLPHFFMSGLYLIVLLRLAVFSAGSLTMEKEARSWPILLTTPLTDREIIRGKAVAAFRRNIPLIMMYFGLLCLSYIGLYSLAGANRLAYVLGSLILSACSIVGSVFFVIGSGLYLGVRLKSTTAAVAATAALYFGITYLFCGLLNPLRLIFTRSILRSGFSWAPYAVAVGVALVHAGIGAAFAWRAVRRLRRNVF